MLQKCDNHLKHLRRKKSNYWNIELHDWAYKIEALLNIFWVLIQRVFKYDKNKRLSVIFKRNRFQASCIYVDVLHSFLLQSICRYIFVPWLNMERNGKIVLLIIKQFEEQLPRLLRTNIVLGIILQAAQCL